MAKAVNIIIALLITLAIVVASGCSGTSNTTKNATPASVPNKNAPASAATSPSNVGGPVQAPNSTNNTTPEYNGSMYPANTIELNESIEEAENITSPEIENATYVKPPQPAEREGSGQSYTPTSFNQSYQNAPVPSGSQSSGRLEVIPTNTSSTVIANNSTQVGNPQRDLVLVQNRTSSNGTIIAAHTY
jgi:hypothetical protein